jgi:hypothetical protein
MEDAELFLRQAAMESGAARLRLYARAYLGIAEPEAGHRAEWVAAVVAEVAAKHNLSTPARDGLDVAKSELIRTLLEPSVFGVVRSGGGNRSTITSAPIVDRDVFLRQVKKRLKEARGQRSVEQFAKDLRTSETVIYKLSKGERRCSHEKLAAIALRLDCSEDELYREEFDRSRSSPPQLTAVMNSTF